MLKGDREDAVPCGGQAPAPGPGAAAPPGRDCEFTTLADALAGGLRGEGCVMTVTGAAASGKTELLRAFAAHARARGACVVGATGSAPERDLAYGILRQLVQAAPLDEVSVRDAARLLEDGFVPDARPADGAAAVAHVQREVCRHLLRLAERTPLVVMVDDIQYADTPSVEFLLYLVRRIRLARVMVVLSERESLAPAHPRFDAELDRQLRRGQVRLGPLPVTAVGEVFCRLLAAPVDNDAAAAALALSGGNPLLLAALAEDCKAAARARGVRRGAGTRTAAAPGVTAAEVRAAVGDAYRRGVMSCLYRMERGTVRVARALAVLGAAAPVQRIGELLGVGAAETGQVLRALHAVGLLDAGYFRHAAAQAAVLDALDPGERTLLHQRAAQVLHADGASSIDVARHLFQAGNLQAAWVLPTLQQAAEQAMADGRVQLAVECLKQAQRSSADEREQTDVRAQRTGMEWLLDPATAGRHLPWFTEMMRARRLKGRQVLLAVRYFTWYGRPDEALEALELFDDAARGPEVGTEAEAWSASALLAYFFPGRRERTASLAARTRRIPAITSRLDGLDVLLAVLEGHADDATIARAEQVLRRGRLAEGMLETLTAALIALAYADQAGRADRWSRELLDQASGQLPVACALLAAFRAEIALRQGNLLAAEECGRLALERIPPEGWGVALGLPVASVVAADVAMGRYEEAARLIDTPMPDAMFQTPAGLQYLHACGRYNLAVGRPGAALHAFHTCGDLMRQWGVDLPGIVPWRVAAAQAHIRCGAREEAQALLDAELARLAPGQSRTRGMALRMRAATVGLKRRPAVLWESVKALQAAGDSYELARALADLGAAYRALGETGRARMVARRAVRLAKQCGAEPLYRALAADLLDVDVPEEPSGSGEAATDLSDAERRVASLAAQGHTNREIARRLYITVSTVEQHLTRVYRKLGVARRLDLPTRLEPDIAG